MVIEHMVGLVAVRVVLKQKQGEFYEAVLVITLLAS